LIGEVLHIDNFGNIISNISIEDFKTTGIHEGNLLSIKIDNKTMNLYFHSVYGEVNIGSPLALFNSSNFFEISVNQGNASKLFKIKVGDPIKVSRTMKS
jgi:S-adenosylmethionine hydrolase